MSEMQEVLKREEWLVRGKGESRVSPGGSKAAV